MDKVRARLAEQFDCPLYTALAVLGGRWKPLILWHLAEDGPQRFLALQRRLQGVPKKVLSQQLKEMAASGIIVKIDFATKAPHTEYRITAYGRTVRPVLDALCDWGEGHLRRAGKPPRPMAGRTDPTVLPAIRQSTTSSVSRSPGHSSVPE